MQNDGQLPIEKQRHYKNVIDGMYRICREEGPKVLLRGIGPSTQRAVLITVSQMTSYDEFKTIAINRFGFQDGLNTHFLASLLSVKFEYIYKYMPFLYTDFFFNDI